MVIVGNYSVRLVHADNKEPFKEHVGPDGKTYAEIEPGVDYFIETEVVGGDPDEHACWKYTVDGKDLRYRSWFNMSNGKGYKGIWSLANGISKSKALSFQRPTLSASEKPGHSAALMGTVKVDVFEAIAAGTKKRKDRLPPSMEVASAGVIPGTANVQTKQAVRSGEGSHSETKLLSTGKTFKSYKAGKPLQSITINYCTVLGLIDAGVLPKPDNMWDRARLVHPWKRSSEMTTIYVEPKRIKIGGFVLGGAGVKLKAPTEHDYFDLCDLPDIVPGSEDDSDGDSNDDGDSNSKDN